MGYSTSRNLTKMVFLFSAIAISTFAMSGFILRVLDFTLGTDIRNLIALSLLIPIFLMRTEGPIIVPYNIPFLKLDKSLRRWIYSIILVIIGFSISTISIPVLQQLLSITVLDFDLLAIRNFIALGLLWAVKVLHFN